MPEPASIPILIGVPVYRGHEFVNETLKSIRDQEFERFRVLVSVDGGDESSMDVCAPFMADPRFQMVVQRERLGWAGNLNWLMSQCSADFFCYWQQDDLCAASYLRLLYEHGIQHPEAACVYSDIQWFGTRTHRDELPSVTGHPLQRVLRLLERPSSEPFRGLIRGDALRAAGPLRSNAYDSRLEDFVWVAKLAREGELHRVSETLYFKRCHETNTHSFSPSVPADVVRGAWIEFGIGILEAALPLVSEFERAVLLNTVLERLLVPRPGRLSFYRPRDSKDVIEFAADFVHAANRRFGPNIWQGIKAFPEPVAILQVLGLRYAGSLEHAPERLVCEIAIRELHFREILRVAGLQGRVEVSFGCGKSGNALLEEGWSIPEEWGVWSNGPFACLRLPVPQDGYAWRLALDASCLVDGLARGESRVIVLRTGEHRLAQWSCTIDCACISGELSLPGPEISSGLLIEFDLPNAVSPLELGLNGDSRRLALALKGLVLRRDASSVATV